MPVYMIRSGERGLVKIGWTRTLTARLRSLQSSEAEQLSLLRVIQGSRLHERALHRLFQDRRIIGEWFEFCEDMLSCEVPAVSPRKTIRIFDMWPDLKTFAADAGISVSLSMVWRSRNNVPRAYWKKLERAAKRRGIKKFSISLLARGVEENQIAMYKGRRISDLAALAEERAQ